MSWPTSSRTQALFALGVLVALAVVIIVVMSRDRSVDRATLEPPVRERVAAVMAEYEWTREERHETWIPCIPGDEAAGEHFAVIVRLDGLPSGAREDTLERVFPSLEADGWTLSDATGEILGLRSPDGSGVAFTFSETGVAVATSSKCV